MCAVEAQRLFLEEAPAPGIFAVRVFSTRALHALMRLRLGCFQFMRVHRIKEGLLSNTPSLYNVSL